METSAFELARQIDSAPDTYTLHSWRRETINQIDKAVYAYSGWFDRQYQRIISTDNIPPNPAEAVILELLITIGQEFVVYVHDKPKFDKSFLRVQGIVGRPKRLTVPQLKDLVNLVN